MAGIFLSYRRSDAGAQAGRLYDRLTGRFGPGSVFRDQDSNDVGRDFAARIDHELTSCRVLIAVIGRDWLSQRQAEGTRLDDPQDWVRIEVATGLSRGIAVIPVLVDGAEMPSEQALPDELRGLARCQAYAVPEATWGPAVEHLILRLQGEVERPPLLLRSGVGIVVAALLLSFLVGFPLYGLALAAGRSGSATVSLANAAIQGAATTFVLAAVLSGARRSAWSPHATLLGAPVLAALFNVALGLVPLTLSVPVLFAIGFGLSGLAALLPNQSWAGCAFAFVLGVVGGLLAAEVDPRTVWSFSTTIAVVGGLTAVAIAAARRPTQKFRFAE